MQLKLMEEENGEVCTQLRVRREDSVQLESKLSWIIVKWKEREQLIPPKIVFLGRETNFVNQEYDVLQYEAF